MPDHAPDPKFKVTLGPLLTDLPFMFRNINAMLRPIGIAVREPLGIPSGSIGILSLIWVNPGISQNDLADNLAIKKSAIARMVKGLESDGLLERTRVSRDRRKNAITLTAEGHRMIARIRQLTVALNDELIQAIPSEDRAVFFATLEKLYQKLSETREGYEGMSSDED